MLNRVRGKSQTNSIIMQLNSCHPECFGKKLFFPVKYCYAPPQVVCSSENTGEARKYILTSRNHLIPNPRMPNKLLTTDSLILNTTGHCMCPFRAILASEDAERDALEVEKKNEGDFDTTFRQVEAHHPFSVRRR